LQAKEKALGEMRELQEKSRENFHLSRVHDTLYSYGIHKPVNIAK
jgi:hypothetical protein